jgi:outer membrane protein assembly factor BamB
MKRIPASFVVLSALVCGIVASAFMGCAEPTPPVTTSNSRISQPADVESAAEEKSEEAVQEAAKPVDEATAKSDGKKQEGDIVADASEASAKITEAKSTKGNDDKQNVIPQPKEGDWVQWGGTGARNNTPVAHNIPVEWELPKFDRKTGKFVEGTGKNIKWVSQVGSQTYGNTVVAHGKVFIGTNNGKGYLKRYPSDIDLGCFICFNEKDGKFLWQHSSEKLPTGRVHDWPLMGICCSPYVEGDRVWFVTSRGEVKCLDVEGFYDGEDDGPVKGEPARLFDLTRADEASEDKVGPAIKELDEGKLPEELRTLFKDAGAELPAEVAIKTDTAGKKWSFKADDRDYWITLAGPRLSGFRTITPADKEEADTVWNFNMMTELGTSQHNMCSCSVTALGDILFVNTSNGVDESHLVVPAPGAPSFIALDKNTGKLLWQDDSPKDNILHGQWGSPAVAVIGGMPQVIFGGGDGWLYSFKADRGKDGKPELLWKFDANPKDSILELGGRGTRNDIISTPVIYDGLVYFATGQDPEHGEGKGILWCVDPTKRGDISESIVVNISDPEKPIPTKRIQAAVEADGDRIKPNPNSGVVWKYEKADLNEDGKIDFEEEFHRSISTVAIQNDLLFTCDFSGLIHCVDAKTGKVYWTHDMLAAAWGSPLIVEGHVYIGDEDGDITVFNVSKEKHDPLAEVSMNNSVYSTPIVANGVLFIANKDYVFAIAEENAEK